MLLAHPALLTDLIREYEMLSALDADDGGPAAQRRLDDIGYSLCMATGTSDVDAALVAARHRLPGARVHDDSTLTARRRRTPRVPRHR
ncbi:DUF5133 domain-containing protein [Streptomyces sp. NBC_00006]|uniref:DUF5133 domain-containing protein n=1 Tax=Streptomyces sp. NBC_00006 TaxID=2975619 RepID=UPI00225A82B2|nr:DUF5133 domain-containing protein [Streptomyces sp. NBC_00006]MCX5537125.1 DUF5133 domain-containing protein [Streptomyces sp. NBC_00006]